MIKVEIYLKSGVRFYIIVDKITIKENGIGDFSGLEWQSTSEYLPHLLLIKVEEIAAIVSTHEREEEN